jgi:hypothetical protein
MSEDCQLTVRERLALDGIEPLLRSEDRALTRRMRTMRLHSPARGVAARFARWPRALAVAFLAGITMCLLLSATLTRATPLVWAFAASWVLTLFTATWPTVVWPWVGRRRRIA